MRCDVLILTSSFGNGHNSVAAAIREQIVEEAPELEVQTVDIMDISSPKVKEAFFWTYGLLTRKHPSVYNYFYRIKKDVPDNGLDKVLYNLCLNRVGKYLDRTRPKLIISTFPLCSGFVSRVKEVFGLDVPLITAITDVVDSWEWIHQETDLYFVPCRHVGDRLAVKGIDKDKIRVTGIPVKKAFLSNEPRQKAYRQVLIMGGAMDKLGLDAGVLRELSVIPNTKTIVVTGGNQALYDRLVQSGPFDNIEILGYTKNIAQLMDNSDLVVTKPGGVTLFEAINKGIPVLMKPSMVGQEEENINFIRSAGIGMLVEKDVPLSQQVRRALESPEDLSSLRQNLQEIREEIEPRKIGAYALELL